MADQMDVLLRRLDVTERNQADLARTVTNIVDTGATFNARLKVLEEIQQDRRVSDVERSARETAMQKDISSIQTDVQAIKGFGTWALRLIAGAVILAFVGFLLNGGIGSG